MSEWGRFGAPHACGRMPRGAEVREGGAVSVPIPTDDLRADVKVRIKGVRFCPWCGKRLGEGEGE